jgi:hypothetical protein
LGPEKKLSTRATSFFLPCLEGIGGINKIPGNAVFSVKVEKKANFDGVFKKNDAPV